MVTLFGSGVAHADPPAGTFRNLAGVGSDTTTPVMQALAESTVLEIAGVKQVASYNATGSATIQTKSDAACSITRPNGSSSGRAALLTALNGADVPGAPAGTKCLQFARASDPNLADATPNLVYVPFAGENVTYAPNNTSNLPKNIPTIGAVSGLDRLRAYYNCQIGATLTGQNTGKPFHATNNPIGYRPMIPQLGSGTGPFWIKTMYNATTVPAGVSTADGGCVQVGTDEFGAIIQEHNGTQVNAQEMTPYSVAQWTSQTAGIIAADVRGNTRIGQIGAINPFGDGFPINRPLYNAIKETVADGVDNANFGVEQRAVFVDTDAGAGNNALICSGAAATIMTRFGLTPASDCGQNLAANTTL